MEASHGQTVEEERRKMENSRPHFFKIIFGEEIKEHMWIPPAFLKKHLTGEISDRVILVGPSGSHWRVKICKDARGTYLKDGWKEFMRGNNLGKNEFLIFRYDGNMRFYVKIFDQSGVKRLVPAAVNKTLGETRPSGEKRPRGRPRKNTAVPLNLHELQIQETKSCKDGGESSGKGKEAGSFTSRFPYFESCMSKSSVQKIFLMSVPQSFAAANLPPCKSKVVLRNSAGKSWDVTCCYNSNRHFFSGGWGAFVHANNLKEGDVCIFELVEKNVMQVHVLD